MAAASPPRNIHATVYPYLIHHNSLLKAWADHGLSAWLLAPAPCRLAIWRLRDSLFFANYWILYQCLVLLTERVRGDSIGARHGRLPLLGVRVVGGDRVVGLGRVFGGDGRDRSPCEGRHNPTGASLQHCVGGDVRGGCCGACREVGLVGGTESAVLSNRIASILIASNNPFLSIFITMNVNNKIMTVQGDLHDDVMQTMCLEFYLHREETSYEAKFVNHDRTRPASASSAVRRSSSR